MFQTFRFNDSNIYQPGVHASRNFHDRICTVVYFPLQRREEKG